jgi:hypothetical protein
MDRPRDAGSFPDHGSGRRRVGFAPGAHATRAAQKDTPFDLDREHVMKNLMLSALVAGAMLAGSDLSAQSKTNGFLLNAHLVGSAIAGTADDADQVDAGGGLGFQLGYGFNDRIALYIGFDGASVTSDDDDTNTSTDYTLGTGELGLRVTFGNEGQRWRPYLNAALTGVVSQDQEDDFDASVSGAGTTLGGGVQYFFSRSLAVDGALNLTSGSYTRAELDGDSEDLPLGVGFNHTRLQLGVTWHP